MASQVLRINVSAVFSTYVDGSNNEQVRDVAFDNIGSVYITGGTQNFSGMPLSAINDFYVSTGNVNHGSFKPHDVFVQKYGPTGSLDWSTRIGGVNYDRAYAIEVDARGGVYVAGRAGEDFYTTSGVLQETFGGNSAGTQNSPYGDQDSFVAKLDAGTGQVDWSTYFGGVSGEIIRDMDVAPDGTIHIGQTFVQAAGGQHISSDAMQPQLNGRVDEIYAQLSNDGTSLLYGTFIGGVQETVRSGGNPSIVVDSHGDYNMLLMTDATNAPTTPGAFRSSPKGATDLYMVKFDGADGGRTIKSATYFGHVGAETLETHNLAIDPAGNFIVAGDTKSTFLNNTDAGFQPNSGGGPLEGFIAVMSADGRHVLGTTFYGGSGSDHIEGIVYHNGSIYITGSTESADLPVTDTSTFRGYNGGRDAFFAVFSADLSKLEYATYLGGSGSDEGRSIDVSSQGAIAIGGMTDSRDFFLKAPADNSLTGGSAGFVTVVQPSTVSLPVVSQLTITASADPEQGPAKAWVIVNGEIVDTIVVSADRDAGNTQTFSVGLAAPLDAGDTLEIRYHNDLHRPNQGIDRNFFLHDVTVDGSSLIMSQAQITAREGFYIADSSSPIPGAGTIFLGTDGGAVFDMADQAVQSVITLTATADIYKGAARANIWVNGQIIDAIEVRAERSLGQTQTFEIGYDHVIDPDDVIAIAFSNDITKPGGDKNFYIADLLVDGVALDIANLQLNSGYGGYDPGTDLVLIGTNGAAIYDLSLQHGFS
jgi:hypothetical protein